MIIAFIAHDLLQYKYLLCWQSHAVVAIIMAMKVLNEKKPLLLPAGGGIQGGSIAGKGRCKSS